MLIALFVVLALIITDNLYVVTHYSFKEMCTAFWKKQTAIGKIFATIFYSLAYVLKFLFNLFKTYFNWVKINIRLCVSLVLKAIALFSMASFGAFIGVIIECGSYAELILGAILSLLCFIFYTIFEKKFVSKKIPY